MGGGYGAISIPMPARESGFTAKHVSFLQDEVMGLGLKNKIAALRNEFIRVHAVFIVHVLYKDIWKLRDICRREKGAGLKSFLYKSYFEHYGAWIGLGAEFENVPVFPHGYFGIFISNSARIGRNAVIYQQVTIGSNMLQGSKRQGAPTLGNDVYIGCGAKLIGKITVGDRARIGANCIVVKDVPENSVTVIRGVESIVKEGTLDNRWVRNDYM